MNFRVGQKVVCVDAGGWVQRLSNGKTYTVTAIGEAFNRNWVGLYETPGKHDLQWESRRFRPLIEKSTDTGMAILREILDRETIRDAPRVPAKSI